MFRNNINGKKSKKSEKIKSPVQPNADNTQAFDNGIRPQAVDLKHFLADRKQVKKAAFSVGWTTHEGLIEDLYMTDNITPMLMKENEIYEYVGKHDFVCVRVNNCTVCVAYQTFKCVKIS